MIRDDQNYMFTVYSRFVFGLARAQVGMLDVSSNSKIEIGSLQALRASASSPSQQAAPDIHDTPDTPDTWQQLLLGIRCKTRQLVFYDVML